MAVALRTYGELKFDAEKGWVIAAAEPHVSIKLKAVFESIPKTDVPPYSLPAIPAIARNLTWFTERYPLRMTDGDRKRLLKAKKEHVNYLNELERIITPDYVPRPLALKDGKEARNYQLVARDVHMAVKRHLLADDIGVGKTVTAILSMLSPGTLPVALVVPVHLRTHWIEKLAEFTDLKVHIIQKSKAYTLPPADVYIFKYTSMIGWVDFFATGYFKMAVYEEIQEMRHRGTGKYDACKRLSDNVDYTLGLSATPIYNYGSEIYSIMNLLKTGCLGGWYDFQREWTHGDSLSDPKAMGTYLRENFLMLRRTRKEVGRELPQKNVMLYEMDYNEHDVAAEEDITSKLAMSILGGTGSFVERGNWARDFDLRLRQQTGIAKARPVAAHVRLLLENDIPVVLAGWHRAVYRIWLEELKEFNPVMYTGSESSKQKDDAKKAFIEGKTNLFIISLRSGVGLDGLQYRCRDVVYGEFDYSPKVHEQVGGRVDRDGQEEQVNEHYPWVDYGSDPVIMEILGVKESQSHGLLNPNDDTVMQQLSDDSRIKKMAEDWLNKKKINHKS